ncbi:Type 1 glutamine amidotransferase-like domain-containing protein [Candidatus Woesearchaeota archaeon]|nr:Type 1 glutamine amidotransferase-like domain-containing protein [Candidatus Woesearchaeota archaeon]
MTKFILHGGYTRYNNEDNKNFFKEITKHAKKVLCVYFAKEKDRWEESFEDDKKKTNFKNMILANEEDIENQIKEADTIWIRGGDTNILKEKLSKINFKKLIEGKTVAGSSAGVYVLVKYYFSNNRRRLEEGFGILNVKAFCHYTDEERENLEKLKQYKEKLEVILLPDCKYVVLEI